MARYVGVALAATNVGIGVQVLELYGLLNKRIGRIILAAAVVDDILALYLLSSLHVGLEQKSDVKQLLPSISISFLALFIFTLVLLWLAKTVHQYFMSYGHLSYFSYHLLFFCSGFKYHLST
ncbi:cation:proton antiporter [Neptuniibacter marinus]|uniref:cation:proton antiporter domain-containing protein n=1 Tax=Neptuniibacter marinus TaxID=1806670 RepID=UPI003B5CB876